MRYNTVADIKKANRQAGMYWFEPGAMRFFNSKTGEKVYGGRYFISSEKFEDEPRRYTIRMADEDGDIYTVGEFMGYASREAAERAVEKMVAEEEEGERDE